MNFEHYMPPFCYLILIGTPGNIFPKRESYSFFTIFALPFCKEHPHNQTLLSEQPFPRELNPPS